MKAIRLLVLLAVLLAGGAMAQAQPPADFGKTVDVGKTGWAVKRPVIASACPHGCPWGELGEFVQEAMKPLGYDVILCRNCNRAEGPRIVGKAARPPPLQALDARTGTTERVDAPLDFGITESGILASAYRGTGAYAADGPYKTLRLIAKIEDPNYLLVAVKRDLGIADLADIKAKKLKVRILSAGELSTQVLNWYGLDRQSVTALGGSIGGAMGAAPNTEFDVIVSDLGTPALNPEANYWTTFSQKYDLRFLDLPEALLAELAKGDDVERVTVRWGLLRGVDHNLKTVGRSGEAVFARADTPDKAAYDVAKAIDQHRADLRWFIRPYSYEPHTVSQNRGVPLHPGARRYYREKGYLR